MEGSKIGINGDSKHRSFRQFADGRFLFWREIRGCLGSPKNIH